MYESKEVRNSRMKEKHKLEETEFVLQLIELS
jgi:hypothetical protein